MKFYEKVWFFKEICYIKSVLSVKNKTMKLQLIISIVILSKLCKVNGVTVEDYKDLQESLMTNYSNKVRPVKNQDHTVQVTASFYLADINDVDVVKQQMVTTAYLSLLWFDELLVWDGEITNIDRLYFKQVSRLCSMSVHLKAYTNS